VSPPLDPDRVRRRFIGLSALRWVPPGLVIPVLVLLATTRGLGVGTVGALFALHGVIVAVLELPTGALADVIGRRVVLVASSGLLALSCVTFAVAVELWQFVVAVTLLAIGRALSSGPLEAWYVDAVHAVDPAADLKPGLSRAMAAEGVALAFGTICGGFLPLAFAGLPAEGGQLITSLSIPALAAAVVALAHMAAVALLVVEPPRDEPAALWPAVRGVPRVVRRGLLLAGRDQVLVRVLVVAAAIGVVISAVEVLSPVRVAELLGGPSDATAAFGVLMTLAFVGGAVGSAAAPAAARLLRTSGTAAAVFCALAAVAAAGLATGSALPLAGAAFVAFYLLLGGAEPLLAELLHHRVAAAERATVVSVQSLVGQVGGVLGSASLPTLAAGAGFAAAMSVGAVTLLGGALLLVRLAAPVTLSPPALAPPDQR
jgi:hypothetical protein